MFSTTSVSFLIFILSLHYLQAIFSFVMICHFDHSDFGFSTCIWAVSYLMCISTVKILGYNGHTFLWLVQVPVTFWKIIFTLRRQMILQFLNIKIFHITIEVLRVWLNYKFIFICLASISIHWMVRLSGGGGGKNGVAFEDQYHVRALQFAKWSKILCTTLFGQIVGLKCWIKEVICFVEHKHHTYHPLPPWEMLVAYSG